MLTAVPGFSAHGPAAEVANSTSVSENANVPKVLRFKLFRTAVRARSRPTEVESSSSTAAIAAESAYVCASPLTMYMRPRSIASPTAPIRTIAPIPTLRSI